MVIPLSGESYPADPESLRMQIVQGLEGIELKARAVEVSGTSSSVLDRLHVDLSGCKIEDLSRLPKWGGTGAEVCWLQVFTLEAHPLTLHAVAVELAARAEAATLVEAKLGGGTRALALSSAGAGTLQLSTGLRQLEQLAQTLLAAQAAKHGAEVVKTDLRISPVTPQAFDFELEVTAKVMIMKAPLTLAGHAELDANLDLRLSNLRLAGSGMAAGLARGFLQPHLEKLASRPIPLGAFSLGGLRLRSASLAVENERLVLSARLGS